MDDVFLKKEIVNIHNKIKFNVKKHEYFLNGEKFKFGVTSTLEKFFEKFDKDKISEREAIKYNTTKEEILKKWEMNKDVGSYIGELLENYIMKDIKANAEDFIRIHKKTGEKLEIINLLYVQGERLVKIKKDKGIKMLSEIRVFNNYFCGSIDFLLINKNNSVDILDFKCTNKIFNGEFIIGNLKKAYEPISHLNGYNFSKYSLQLSFYAYLLENSPYFKHLNLKINELKILHLRKNYPTSHIYRVKYLKEEIENIIEEVLKEN